MHIVSCGKYKRKVKGIYILSINDQRKKRRRKPKNKKYRVSIHFSKMVDNVGTPFFQQNEDATIFGALLEMA